MTAEGEVEGHSEFATVAVAGAGCALRTGRWYYEVETHRTSHTSIRIEP